MRARFLVVSALILALDQWTKLWIEGILEPHERVEVLPGFFDLVHVQNTGGRILRRFARGEGFDFGLR